jgi:hypothetical protein
MPEEIRSDQNSLTKKGELFISSNSKHNIIKELWLELIFAMEFGATLLTIVRGIVWFRLYVHG